jgi:hypothetical protein
LLPLLIQNLADAKAPVSSTSAVGKAVLLFEANFFQKPLKTIINNHIGRILEAASTSMISRQLLRSHRSPFFGDIYSRMRANSLRSAVTGGADVTCAGASVTSSTRSESEKIRR